MKNKLDEIVMNLSGDSLLLDWNGHEKLINLKDLVDNFKEDMRDLKNRGDTDDLAVEYLDTQFSIKLLELAEYSKGISVTEKRTIN